MPLATATHVKCAQPKQFSGSVPAYAPIPSVNVDIVQKIVILVPVSAPFALRTLELIINNRLHVKKLRKIIFQ